MNLQRFFDLKRWEGTTHEARYLLQCWHDGAARKLKQVKSFDPAQSEHEETLLRGIDLEGKENSGLSSVGLGVLAGINSISSEDKYRAATIIVHFATTPTQTLLATVQEISAIDPILSYCLEWALWDRPYDFYRMRNHAPLISANRDLIVRNDEGIVTQPKPSLPYGKVLSGLTKGQVKAFKTLNSYRAVRSGVRFKKFRPSFHALLVGLSGSGKTHVCRRFAQLCGLETLELTLSSWILTGSRSDKPTMSRIFESLSHSPCVIVLDEIDKVRINAGDNSNYFRAVIDEIMCLLDNRLDLFQPSRTIEENLDMSWIITAGAFQDLYRKKIGGTGPLVSEEIETLDPLTHGDIMSSGWLPDELLNRLAPEIIEVRQPDLDEYISMLAEAEAEVGMVSSADFKSNAAREILMKMQGIRGVEAFALLVGKNKIYQDYLERLEKRGGEQNKRGI